MSLEPHTTSHFSHFYAADIDMPDSNPRKGLIPLITSTSGAPLHILRDSKYWCQSILKLASMTTSLYTPAPQIRPPPSHSCSCSVTMAPSQMATVAEEDNMANESQFFLEDAWQVASHPAYGHTLSAPAQHPPSSWSTNNAPHPSNQPIPLLIPATDHMHKCAWDWPEDYELPSHHRHPFPPTATREPLPLTSRDQDVNNGDITWPQPSFNLESNVPDPTQQTGIDTYFRRVRPSSQLHCVTSQQGQPQHYSQPQSWCHQPSIHSPHTSHYLLKPYLGTVACLHVTNWLEASIPFWTLLCPHNGTQITDSVIISTSILFWTSLCPHSGTQTTNSVVISASSIQL